MGRGHDEGGNIIKKEEKTRAGLRMSKKMSNFAAQNMYIYEKTNWNRLDDAGLLPRDPGGIAGGDVTGYEREARGSRRVGAER